MDKGNFSPKANSDVDNEVGLPTEKNRTRSSSCHSLDGDTSLAICRVCQCVESDKMGDATLGFLGIIPPLQEASKTNADWKHDCNEVLRDADSVASLTKHGESNSGFVEFVSPQGEVFICRVSDIEMGSYHQEDTLIELGCSCKSDLALVHYACALKWFINRGSTVCEICGCVAKNVKTSDLKRVLASLKDYEALRERTANGEPNPTQLMESSGIDPDAVAAIRRQRLSEISLWFNLHASNSNNPAAVSQVASEQPVNIVAEESTHAENPATKWAVEGTGVLLATGLLTITLAWLIAPRVGKKAAKSGLRVLFGGFCALAVVIFFRFIVLARIRYGPARYWAILFVFWFLVFGIWASRTHGAHTT